MTVHLVALELFATVRVGSQGSSLESIPDVRQVGDPPKIDWNGVKRDEEPGEQQEWNRHHRSEEHTVLDVHGGTDDQTHALCNEGNQQTGSQEHCETEPLEWLGREVVHDRYVEDAEDSLGKRQLIKWVHVTRGHWRK